MQHTIDDIQIQHYRLSLDPPFPAAWDPRPRSDHHVTLVRVTVGPYEGVGSGDLMLGLHGHEPLFIGRNPFDIERHVHVLDNLQFHYGRMWPLEVALWDVMGKISAKPLWQMLGGNRPSIRVYASTGVRMPVEERIASVLRLKKEGFPAVKVRFHAADPREDIAAVQNIRDAAGPEIKILVDANQGWQMPYDTASAWDFKTALWVAEALSEFDVYWLEEPLPRHYYRGLAELRNRLTIRIAGGEGNREFSELLEYLHHESLDVYQPDAVWSTGILRARQIANHVTTTGAIYSPHTWGDGLVLLANLHVAAAVSNAPFVEFPYDPPYWTPERRDYMLPEPIRSDHSGTITLSDAPGLGVTIDWKSLEAFRI